MNKYYWHWLEARLNGNGSAMSAQIGDFCSEVTFVSICTWMGERQGI